MTQNELTEYLLRQRQLLEKLAANAETQLRFIQNLQMKGLVRLTKERDVLFGELVTVHQKLLAEQVSPSQEFIAVLQTNKLLKDRILGTYQNALIAANAQQNTVRSNLRQLRAKRSMEIRYAQHWTKNSGHRVNIRG